MQTSALPRTDAGANGVDDEAQPSIFEDDRPPRAGQNRGHAHHGGERVRIAGLLVGDDRFGLIAYPPDAHSDEGLEEEVARFPRSDTGGRSDEMVVCAAAFPSCSWPYAVVNRVELPVPGGQ